MEEELRTPGPAPGPPPVTRPNLLTILCILTFINGGLTLISSIFVGAFFEQFVAIATDFATRFKLPGLEMITEGRPLFFFVNAVLYAVSVAGAILMWQLKKIGFHIYTTAQILLILSPMYFFHLPGPSIFDIILSGTFVILYSTHLKLMT
jgi:hypothetical protein